MKKTNKVICNCCRKECIPAATIVVHQPGVIDSPFCGDCFGELYKAWIKISKRKQKEKGSNKV